MIDNNQERTFVIVILAILAFTLTSASLILWAF